MESSPRLVVADALAEAHRQGASFANLGDVLGADPETLEQIVLRLHAVVARSGEYARETLGLEWFEREFDDACPGLLDELDSRLAPLGLDRVERDLWSHRSRGRRTHVGLSTATRTPMTPVSLEWLSKDGTGELSYKSQQFASSGVWTALKVRHDTVVWQEDDVLFGDDARAAFMATVDRLIGFCSPVLAGRTVAQVQQPLLDLLAAIRTAI